MITHNIVGLELSANGTTTVSSENPKTLSKLKGDFVVATDLEIEATMQKAFSAWRKYRQISGVKKGEFLRAIANEIEELGDTLVNRAMAESGLPEGRIRGERGRTTSQLRLFASLIEEGSWVEATVDTKTPVDLRKMLIAVGPVVIFTASNFPLAFSTAGGDTASALASGCPVIVKAHESHLGTNALVAEAIQKAAQKTNMPDGVFSSLNGNGYDLGKKLVQHSLTKSVAFTGSFRGGMALHKLAQQRKTPIPVFAEMGSTNPIFLLPNKVKNEKSELATDIANSVNLGAGQFCTNPGLLVALDNDATKSLIKSLKKVFSSLSSQTMLNQGIYKNFEKNKNAALKENGVKIIFNQTKAPSLSGKPAIATIKAKDFLANPKLHEEVFGPFTLMILCKSVSKMERVAEVLEGQLTATVMGEASEIADNAKLIHKLEEKVGRLIFNGLPTGVAVTYAMQHGGPFPASTDSRFTSVGTSAIKRFARPITFQNAPSALLPDELKTKNPLKIWRTIDGEQMK